MAGETTTAQLRIDLDANIEGAAESSAQALDQLRDSIKADTAEIGSLRRALKNLEGGTKVSIKQVYELKDAIASKKQALAQAQAGYVSLGGSFKATAKAAKQPGDAIVKLQAKLDGMKKANAGGVDKGKSLEKFGEQARKLPGPLGEIVGKLGDVKSLIAGGDLGFLAIAAGLTALVAATVVAIGKLTAYGIAQGDARRSELLRMEGLTKIRSYYGLAAGNAKEMQAAIDRVAASSAASRSEIAGYSDELYRMGLRGDNLSQALEGVAIKSTVQGEAAAHAFAGWAAGAALTGQSVKRLADNVKSRLGGIAQKQMASLTVQAMKQKESFDALFSGLNIEKFVNAKKTVSDLLSQTTNSGKAIKALLTGLVQPIVDMATKSQPLIKRFFQGMIQEALILDIQWLRLKIAFKRAFAQPDVLKGIDKTTVALKAGKVVVWSIAAALAFAAGAMIAFAWPVLLAGAAIWGLVEIGEDLYQLWDEIDWAGLGTAIGDGIVNGVKSAWDAVVNVTTELADAVWSSFKAKLGIHSPSTVFARLGLAIPQGVAVGVERGSPSVQSAVDDMIDVPRSPGPATGGVAPVGGGAAGKLGGGDQTFNFGDIYVSGAKDAPSAKTQAQDFLRELENALEGVGIQLGASITGAAA